MIDDDRDVAMGLAEVLTSHGHDVRAATSADRVSAAVQGFEVELALVDIQLGRDNGLELIKNLKNGQPNLQAVVVTARADQQSAIDALRSGADDYLNKPLRPDELFEVLGRCFERIDRQSAEPAATGMPTPEFAANIGHDLRDPLNAVIGFSEILSAEMLGPLGSEQYRNYAIDINKAGQRLTSVIDGMMGTDKGTPVEGKAVEQDESIRRGAERAPPQPPATESPDTAEPETPNLSDPLVAAYYAGNGAARTAPVPEAPSPAAPGAAAPTDPEPDARAANLQISQPAPQGPQANSTEGFQPQHQDLPSEPPSGAERAPGVGSPTGTVEPCTPAPPLRQQASVQGAEWATGAATASESPTSHQAPNPAGPDATETPPSDSPAPETPPGQIKTTR